MTEIYRWTTLSTLQWTKEYLQGKGVSNARLEAEWLLCSATGLDRVGLYLQYDKPLNEQELASYRSMVSRRGRREPLQHILGNQEFYGLDFTVSADVLIPRHDSEVLVGEAVIRCPHVETVLDIGTGSGCLAIVLQKMLPRSTVTAIDISQSALEIARRNAVSHSVTIEFLLGNLFEPVMGRTFDLIISNPPYIPTADISCLEPEVKDYDPLIALDGGIDGLDLYRRLIRDAGRFLCPGGWLLCEVGVGQSSDVAALFAATGTFHQPIVVNDTAPIPRVVGAMRKELV